MSGDVRIEMKGKKAGRLLVTGYAYTKDKRAYWNCLCDCGNKLAVMGKPLRQGKTQSCGCLQIDRARQANTTHGKAKTLLWGVWQAMKTRTTNKNGSHWKYYGGKGIKICDEWSDYQTFHDWAMANGYQKGLSIERNDGDKDYEPSNCRWIPNAEQQRNKSNNVKFLGETAAEASRRLGGCKGLVQGRIRLLGWDIKRAFTQPLR